MSTDRELLELAAKAAGFECRYINELFGCEIFNEVMEQSEFWNPLDNDGDCFRLAVTLTVDHGVTIEITRHDKSGNALEHAADPCGAARRAVVLVAAAIGRAMP